MAKKEIMGPKKPQNHLTHKNFTVPDKVVDVQVIRCSPCGSTHFVAEEMVGESRDNLPIKAGLRIQHYPCRAPKMRLFTDDECKKEMAANFHKEAFEEALKLKK